MTVILEERVIPDGGLYFFLSVFSQEEGVDIRLFIGEMSMV